MAPSVVETLVAPSILSSKQPFAVQHDAQQARQKSLDGLRRSHELAQKVMLEKIARINPDTCSSEDEAPFMVADMGEIYRQFQRWKVALPRVKPFYAVKCNDEAPILQLATALGMGFDCASFNEIKKVLTLNVDPSRIIFAHPCVSKVQTREAVQAGVLYKTFDREDELHKAKRSFSAAKLILRIITDDSGSKIRVNEKFGASLDEAAGLLQLAKDLQLNVCGVSFHVGSDSSNPQSFLSAVKDARVVFDLAAQAGFAMELLDVGGGFTDKLFEEMASVLNAALDDYIPASIRVIAEPGRFFVNTAFTLAAHVDSIRVERDATAHGPTMHVHFNEGVYGTLANVISDHQERKPLPLRMQDASGAELTRCRAWGPTCDNFDLVDSCSTVAGGIHEGDWMFFREMGAYTMPCRTSFNGYSGARAIYTSSEPGAASLLGWEPEFWGYL